MIVCTDEATGKQPGPVAEFSGWVSSSVEEPVVGWPTDPKGNRWIRNRRCEILTSLAEGRDPESGAVLPRDHAAAGRHQGFGRRGRYGAWFPLPGRIAQPRRARGRASGGRRKRNHGCARLSRPGSRWKRSPTSINERHVRLRAVLKCSAIRMRKCAKCRCTRPHRRGGICTAPSMARRTRYSRQPNIRHPGTMTRPSRQRRMPMLARGPWDSPEPGGGPIRWGRIMTVMATFRNHVCVQSRA